MPLQATSDIKIGIITALPKEFAAVKATLANCTEHYVPGKGAGRRYTVGDIRSLHGGCHRVALALAEMGNNMASARAALLLEHVPSLEMVLMVGIAGGVPCPTDPELHVRLGDVAISDKKGVVQYDMVKQEECRANPIATSAKAIEAVRLLQAEELRGQRPWDAHIVKVLKKLNQKRPGESADKLCASSGDKAELCHPQDPRRLNGVPRIFLGPVASANVLLKDPVKRDLLREKFGVRAVEMEGSGIADATWQHQVGYVVIRGICDYCDSFKNDAWQDYAAAAAAGYTKALVESMFVENPPPAPNPP